jgi:nucleoporin NUP82
MSPFGDYLAIATSHTVHIAILQDAYELDIGPLRLKTFQLGPTEHVLESSPIVSLLWHPLGMMGRCFVTITQDGIVRMWEVNRDDRSSFDKCSMSIDLRKLVNATDSGENLGASHFGVGKAFSPDAAYLEPVAACFGGLGRPGEHPWSSMTLWIATSDGDVYALCPLVPTKIQSYPGLIDSLSHLASAKAKEASISLSEQEKLRQQTMWIQDLEGQDPFLTNDPLCAGQIEVYSRPSRPRPEPKLQGPFDLGDRDLDIADILVRNVRAGEEPIEFETGEYLVDDDPDLDPMGLSVICLLTKDAKVHTFLDLEGVEACWLPATTPQSTPKKQMVSTMDELPVLTHFECLDLAGPNRGKVAPTITPDARSAYAYFVTHAGGVSYVSMESWIEKLENELQDPSRAGLEFRVNLFLDMAESKAEYLIKFDRQPEAANIVSCSVMLEMEIGYFVVTSQNGQPYAATLDTRYQDLKASVISEPVRAEEPTLALPTITREPYRADDRFFEPNQASRFLREAVHRRNLHLQENIKLTPEILDLLIEAHQVFSRETQRMSEAAAGTFRACTRMLDEYSDQLEKLKDLAYRVDNISEEDIDFPDAPEDGPRRIQDRLADISVRQQELQAKCRRVQKKVASLNVRQMSEKELEFARELREVQQDVEDESNPVNLLARVEEVKKLMGDVTERSQNLPAPVPKGQVHASHKLIPAGLRKARMAAVWQLLEREAAMVESTAERLQKLNLQARR